MDEYSKGYIYMYMAYQHDPHDNFSLTDPETWGKYCRSSLELETSNLDEVQKKRNATVILTITLE